MQGDFTAFLIGALAIMLLIAAIGDLRTREISNWLNGAIALLAIPFWWSVGLSFWPDMAIQIGIAAVIFLIFAGLFYLGAMGGGDVKMVAALALWLPAGAVLNLLVIMSIGGGVLTLVMLIRHRMKKSGEQLEIPYGVAIAFGGFWVLAEPFLNHFV
ncbi:MAG: prepilin peptidase [Sphingosinicella sp.]|nr:prepilin peptidase [Sphingosinicella sp.]